MDANFEKAPTSSGNINFEHVLNDITSSEPLRKPVIVLDPGHSGQNISNIDPVTKLHDHDYPNYPEITEAWRVAQQVGDKLRADGYDVVFTKQSELDTVSLRQRATIAQNVHADLAVSIHDDHGRNFSDFAQVFAQEVGEYRGGVDQPKVEFTNQKIADESHDAALTFVSERAKAEGHSVKLTRCVFDNRPGIEPGNISQVQLYAGDGPNAVPWVYNEVGGIGLGPVQEAAYAKGIAEAIEKSVPLVPNPSASFE